jgi:hypothetical protein
MKDPKLNLNTLPFVIQEVTKLAQTGKEYRVSFSDWKAKRSLPANAAYYAWLPAISDFIAMTVPETRNVIKLDFGIPIVLSDEQIGVRFGEALNRKGFFGWSREMQIAEMEFLQVTSLMNTKQHHQMRDNIQIHFGMMGLSLDYKK